VFPAIYGSVRGGIVGGAGHDRWRYWRDGPEIDGKRPVN